MNNPGILVAPSGPQFLTTPDGQTAPDVAGNPVDLTGVPLTVAPSYAFDVGTGASISASTVGVDMTVTNLTPGNLTADLVGKRMRIEGAMEGDVGQVAFVTSPVALVGGLVGISSADLGRSFQVAGSVEGSLAVATTPGPVVTITGLTGMSLSDVGKSITFTGVNPLNNGTFVIAAFISPASVDVTNPVGVIDPGFMDWYVTPGNNGEFDIVGANDGIPTFAFIENPSARPGPATLKWRIVPQIATDTGRNVDAGNDGTYSILTVVDPITVVLTNPNALAIPDPFNLDIDWAVLPALTDFPPGDPLSYIARLQIPDLNVNQPAPGPATFGDYNPTLPPLVVNDSSGLFSKVQAT